MTDSINREDAIEVMCRVCGDYCTEEDMQNCPEHYELTHMLPAGPRWIPVSEKLPEKMGLTLVTTIWGANDRTTEWAYYFGNNIKWGTITDNVIAWMPIPEPYKAESENS